MDNNNHITNHKAIYFYNRPQAIEDGILVDVTDMAKAVGIKGMLLLLLRGLTLLNGQTMIEEGRDFKTQKADYGK